MSTVIPKCTECKQPLDEFTCCNCASGGIIATLEAKVEELERQLREAPPWSLVTSLRIKLDTNDREVEGLRGRDKSLSDAGHALWSEIERLCAILRRHGIDHSIKAQPEALAARGEKPELVARRYVKDGECIHCGEQVGVPHIRECATLVPELTTEFCETCQGVGTIDETPCPDCSARGEESELHTCPGQCTVMQADDKIWMRHVSWCPKHPDAARGGEGETKT